MWSPATVQTRRLAYVPHLPLGQAMVPTFSLPFPVPSACGVGCLLSPGPFSRKTSGLTPDSDPVGSGTMRRGGLVRSEEAVL